MKEIYSNMEDCIELYNILKNKLGNKIDYYGSLFNFVITGKYFFYDIKPHSDIDYLFKKGLPFYIKYCKDGFLRIGVGEDYHYKSSFGERLAALSDFYEVLSEEFGEPDVFYTTKDDDEKMLTLHWAFIDKEETINKFKNGTIFDDAKIDELLIIGNNKKQNNNYHLKDSTKKHISSSIGLPFEMLYLVDENIKDYIKYKKGKEIKYSENARIDGYPITTLEETEKKMKKRTKQN